MLSDKMQKAINKQINAEIGSAYLYYSMSAWFQGQDLPGCANWMRVQALEELSHGDKFFAYMVDRGGRVLMDKLDKPVLEWKSPLDAFKAVLEHEFKVTASIHALVDLARKESDHTTENMLGWFVAEQVQEESSAEIIIKQIKMLEKAPGGLFLLDKDLGARVFVPPVTTKMA